MDERICAVEGCESPVRSRGWCKCHYDKWYRNGDPLAAPPPNRFQPGHPYGKRFQKGDPPRGQRFTPGHTRSERGEANQNWKGDEVSVRGLHRRLDRTRGKASDYPCADCGDPAREWGFDEPCGSSTDLSRYRPVCRSCHLKQDRNGWRSR